MLYEIVTDCVNNLGIDVAAITRIGDVDLSLYSYANAEVGCDTIGVADPLTHIFTLYHVVRGAEPYQQTMASVRVTLSDPASSLAENTVINALQRAISERLRLDHANLHRKTRYPTVFHASAGCDDALIDGVFAEHDGPSLSNAIVGKSPYSLDYDYIVDSIDLGLTNVAKQLRTTLGNNEPFVLTSKVVGADNTVIFATYQQPVTGLAVLVIGI